MNASKTTKRLGLPSIVVILLSGLLLLSLIGLIIFPLFFPTNSSDGTENYLGAERIAAQKAVDFKRANKGPALFSPGFRVTEVVLTSPEGICNDSFGGVPSGPDERPKARYAVSIEEAGLLGMGAKKLTIHVCAY